MKLTFRLFCGATAVTICSTIVLAGPAASSYDSAELTLDQRVLHQRAIEEVYWRHRIWPAENPAPKPALEAVLSATLIRERVVTYLQKGAALELYWHRPLTGEQLQAELNRMVRETKNPDLLRELFDALGNDPFLIAECLARPLLTDRLTRSWYAGDSRFHGALRAQAEWALAAWRRDGKRVVDPESEQVEIEWRLVPDETQSTEVITVPADRRIVELDTDQWREQIVQFARAFGTAQEVGPTQDPSEILARLPLEFPSAVVEKDDRFEVTVVLSSEPDRFRTALVHWRKRALDSWWAKEGRPAVESAPGNPSISPPVGGYELRSPSDGGCTDDSWTSFSNPPKGRSILTAVWTGTEMIVWGGFGGGQWEHNTGGRYNPATDHWTPTSTGSAVPIERYMLPAVWTGTEMIVWGGHGLYDNANQPLFTGGRYNPTTDSWIATSTAAGTPAARCNHSAVWTGSEMIVWGGGGGHPTYTHFNTGGRYDPLTDTWAPTAWGPGVPSGRSRHTAVWTGSAMIVWGGTPSVYATEGLHTGGSYDPAAGTWAATSTGPGMPKARFDHTAVWTGTEMIVWGGDDDATRYNDGGRYDPATESWTDISTGSAVPSARANHTAVWTGTEMIVWGGEDPPIYEMNSGGRYNPETDTWMATSTGPGVPSARESHAAVWTGTEMIVWGGWSAQPVGSGTSSGGRYDPVSDSWVWMAPEAPRDRLGHTSVWTGTEMIVWGGLTYASGSIWYAVDTGGRFDPATGNWTPTSDDYATVPRQRMNHTAVWTGTEMIVWGGVDDDSGGNQLDTGGRYNPTTDSWTATSTGAGNPDWRSDHTAVWTGSEMIVWGGRRGSDLSNGGRYDPVTDTWNATSTGTGVPSARSLHTAVWTGTEMVVWGGIGVGDLAAGGRYSPLTDSWKPTSTALGAPQSRRGHTAVWTGTEMIIWGGYAAGVVDTGGRYDPETDNWSATSTGAGVPLARSGHTAIWTGLEVIIWGGIDSSVPGGRYDPVTDSWVETSVGADVPRTSLDHTAVWTGTEMVVWGGSNPVDPLDVGGMYCACEGGAASLWYPDMDGDGYGAETTAVQSCEQPPGYIDVGGDCDDTNPGMFYGAVEVNDGLDNQCPGEEGRGLVDEITGGCGFHNPAEKNELSWAAQGGATSYEVARSTDREFFTDCLATETLATTWTDDEPVPVGVCFHYLVRALSPNAGSWGVDSDGAERVPVCP